MDFKNLEKVEKKVKKPTFGEDFKSLNTILRGLSFLGNGASIILASFFITSLLLVAISNYWVATAIAVVTLIGLEATKREVFYRFSRDFIRTKKVFQANAFSMLFFTSALIGMSFYSSLTGAQQITSKGDNLIDSAQVAVDTYTDSIRNMYQTRISKFESQNEILFEQNLKIDNRMDELPTNYITERKRMREEKKYNVEQIKENDIRIDELITRMNDEILAYKDRIDKQTSRFIDTNKKDSFTFIIISTIIEFLILIGIYFNNLYNYRSHKDHKIKLLNDKSYSEHFNAYRLLDTLFMNRKQGDLIPDNEIIKKVLRLNKIYFTDTQLNDYFNLFEALKILEVNGEFRILNFEYEESEKIINEHYG